MRILVAGGAGYIGSNMTAMLADEGHQPVVYDNLSKGHKAAIEGFEFVKGDLDDFDLLAATLKKYEIETVMHFGAFIEAGESVTEPLKYYRNNVSNTQTLLSAMEKAGVGKFVFSSSAAVYGIPDKSPVTEQTPKNPVNPYGETKLAVERMCHHQAVAGKLNYAALRYFNACGAGRSSTLGEDHRPESHLIPLTIFAATGKTYEIKIFGTDYPTPDGTCIRDYIHIEDLCLAHLLAMKKLDKGSELIYNLGIGKGHSVREVIDTVKKASGKSFKVIETQRRPGDPPVLVCDATKAKKELGWQPKWTSLEKIVESAWKWHSRYPNGYED
ncbi:MAG: UDP-glucose 4-epimerase GalE [Sedimentisphaerales bacterium]|nr:UDP-glucose 4-epimerase GalE [Sedimentisphaerales bacterium]